MFKDVGVTMSQRTVWILKIDRKNTENEMTITIIHRGGGGGGQRGQNVFLHWNRGRPFFCFVVPLSPKTHVGLHFVYRCSFLSTQTKLWLVISNWGSSFVTYALKNYIINHIEISAFKILSGSIFPYLP